MVRIIRNKLTKISLLIALLFANSIFAVDNKAQYILTRLDYNNSSGEKGVTYFSYNEKGLYDLSIWELENGKRYSLNSHFYDNNGNMIKKVREYSDHKNTVQVFKYNQNNLLEAEEFYLLDTLRGTTTYEYNSQNQLIKINCNKYNGWITGVINFSYLSDGRKDKGELIQKDKRAAAINYVYDDNNNLIKETWNFEVGWEQVFIYNYDKKDNIAKSNFTKANPFISSYSPNVLKEEYKYGDKLGGPSFYKYDNMGKLFEKIFERSDGLTTNTFYVYNIDGTLKRAFRRMPEKKNALFRFDYNRNRKMTKKEFFMNDGAYGKEEYYYDESGSLQSAEYENSDLWLNGKLAFDKGDDGLLTKATYNDKQDFTAVIKFSYNEKKYLTEVLWDFSFGKQQIYKFEY